MSNSQLNPENQQIFDNQLIEQGTTPKTTTEPQSVEPIELSFDDLISIVGGASLICRLCKVS